MAIDPSRVAPRRQAFAIEAVAAAMQPRRASALAGLAAPVASLGAIFLATLLSPTFSWTESALSNLGAPGEPTAPLFNGGLILGGLLALGFGPALWTASDHPLERAGIALFALTAVSLGLIGVFPLGTPEHFPVAVGFYLLLSLSLWIYGAGEALAGTRARGLATVGLGAVNVAAWVVWTIGGSLRRAGLALPEIVGAVVLAGWTVATARRLLDSR
jgi:hypothetical membrane protein